jgi:hypothetical protein
VLILDEADRLMDTEYEHVIQFKNLRIFLLF